MRKIFIILNVLFSAVSLSDFSRENSQTDVDNIQKLYNKQYHLENKVRKQHDSIKQLSILCVNNNKSIDSLTKDLKYLHNALDNVDRSLSQKIETTNNDLIQTKICIEHFYKKLTIFACLVLLLIFYASLYLYHILQKKLLDNKMFCLFKKESIDTKDINHSFVLKVADEIMRIEMNLYRMDKNAKGYKQLSKAVEKMKDNFSSLGYEIVNMLGTTYDEGLRINADFIIDESLQDGSRIITNIIKPQINYNGKMIQKATVIVSQNI